MNTLLLGFDCRLSSAKYVQSAWDQRRRDCYLLRTDIDAPVSVDTAVLPSIFNFDEANDDAGRIHLKPADFHQQALRLWRNLGGMQSALGNERDLRIAMIIAIRLHHENLETDDWWRDFSLETVTPVELDGSWLPIGFDVADRHLTSAVSNCGYAPEVKTQAESKWSTDINEFGLIASAARAAAFRRYSDSRVREHSPFFVFEVLRRQAR